MRNRFLLLLLGLLGLRLATLPILPILDPSESRYAVVARDMLHSGDFVTPMIWASGEYIPFFSKPPLLFWLEAGAMSVMGVTETAARLPSFLAAVGVLWLTWWTVRRHHPPDLTQGALLILLSCPLFFLTAGIGLTDMLLCLSVAGALSCHRGFTHETDSARARRFSLGTFTLLGLGMITKGPIALVLFGLPTLCWTLWHGRLRDLGNQAWWPGLLLFLLPWLPWYLLAERATPGFLEYFLLNENLLRFVASEYGDRYGGGHKFPPGAAIVFLLLACLPWAAVLGWRIRDPAARRAVLERLRCDDLRFYLFAIVIDVLFLSLSRHILGTYVLPVLPAAAIVLAACLASAGFDSSRQARAATVLVGVYAILVVLLLPIVRGRWSSQTILAMAEEFQAARGSDGRIVFVEKRPFSARFYGGPEVDQIPWDAGNEHYEWYVQPDNGHVLILRSRHPDVIDPYVTQRIRPVDGVGRYSLWEPVAPGP